MLQAPLNVDLCCGYQCAADAILLPFMETCQLHRDVLPALKRLTERAAGEGFDLCVASGFRSFERQLVIWNAKAQGLRPVLDDTGAVVDLSVLGELEKVIAIMRYSALPGGSRHHWGSDLDVYDRNGLTQGDAVQLLPSESEPGGPFYEFHRWLNVQLANGRCEDFYRPYDIDRGGVAPEPWHLSYAPLAQQYQSQFTVDMLSTVIEHADIEFKATILDNLSYLFQRFITLPSPVQAR